MELHIHEKPDVTIALNMIIKNEAHIIIKTLENLCSYFDFSYWVICDTGSTDDTQKLIEDFFLSKKIEGEFHQSEWKNFGYNRSEALVKAYNKSDYLLIFDADDSIKGNLVLPETFNFDTYKLMFGEPGGFRYSRPLLINNRKKYKFIGVLHEYLTSMEPSDTTADLKGDYYLISGREGNRSKDANKYLKDAAVLEQAIVEEKDKFLKNRYVFYCAQSYKDGGNRAKAIEYYKKCLDLPIWDQERYYSAYMLGDLYKRSNDDEKALFYCLKSSEYDTHRIEGIVNASRLYREKGMNNMVCTLYNTYKNYKQWNGEHIRKLFIDTGKYNNMLELCCSICAGYASQEFKYLGYEACKEILISNKLGKNHIATTIHNLQFYKKYLEEDSDTLGLFTAFDDYLAKTPYTSNAWNDDLWHRLFDKNVPALTAPTKHTPAANNAQPWIMITLTTCKRFHLFEKTMNSILNQWSDYKKIDYWFCVDDNSSIEDREKMKEAYPWCDFYLKTMEEKGHRKSMNIIWNKLNTLKPKYWIHMEDDFLFHTNMNYIGRAIEGLRQLKGENVKQILFNRCYGETIRDYRLVSYIKKDNGFSLQDYKQGHFNSHNSHYWPHFSFRPSMVDCEAILKLGNFDSHNQFFEMDYAQRWTKAGYKSGFFNRITNRHIGRLTSERSQKNIPNAYELNSERQFVSLPPYINIVHLERRPDRKKSTIEKLSQAGIDKYQFITAVDGRELILTKTQYEMFQGNDFGSKRGVVGCALSHYNLWKQLLEDKDHNYYLIMEDDCTLSENFKENLEILKKEMEKKDVVFLGYSMFEKEREKVKKEYNCSTSTVKLATLNKSLYIGGFFCYLINKNGAKKMVKYIAKNGIKHGIDYLMKIVPNINAYETRPQLAFSVWNENGKKIDTDIQTDNLFL